MSERFRPGLTVGLIVLKENSILLLRRANTGWADGLYGLPAGCADGQETVTHATIREASEEAGIQVLPEWLTFGCVLHTAKTDGRQFESIDFFFITRQWSGTITNAEPHKCDDIRFFPLNALPTNMVPHLKMGIENSLKGIVFAEYGW